MSHTINIRQTLNSYGETLLGRGEFCLNSFLRYYYPPADDDHHEAATTLNNGDGGDTKMGEAFLLEERAGKSR